jgi:two-component system, NtrC family, sensor kinase
MEKTRILLVDDEDAFRISLGKRLATRNLGVLQAANGEECLAVLDKEPVDVVILDVKMPGMDGIETLHHIKKRHASTEVIMLTGHATTQDGIEGIRSGAFDFLTKPVEFEHLLGKISQAHERVRRIKAEKQEAAFRAQMELQMIVTERMAALAMATGVAHEINNPLAIIQESAGWMRQILGKADLETFPRRKDFERALGKIDGAVDRAGRITRQLLEAVKSQETLVVEVDLEALAKETMGLVRHEARKKNIRITLAPQQTDAKVLTDPYHLRQVLLNLFSNAIHATAPDGEIMIHLQANGGEADISVQDWGCGIPKENMEKIFEPFFSTKSASEGTGLGLYVTQKIIKKLGGLIAVESQPGRGTTFHVKLPARNIQAK